jgi:hypothetical protein
MLRTPQGIVVLISIAVYLISAVLFVFSDIAPPFEWETGKAVAVFIAWPVLLFMLFVKRNMPEFLPSWPKAILLSFYAIAPFVFISLGKLSSVD